MEIPGDSGAKIDLPRKKCAGTGREGARLREVAGEREKQAFLAAERQGVAHQASRVHFPTGHRPGGAAGQHRIEE